MKPFIRGEKIVWLKSKPRPLPVVAFFEKYVGRQRALIKTQEGDELTNRYVFIDRLERPKI